MPRRGVTGFFGAAAGVDRGGCGSFASLPWLPRRPPSWRETAVGTRRRRAKHGRKTGVAIFFLDTCIELAYKPERGGDSWWEVVVCEEMGPLGWWLGRDAPQGRECSAVPISTWWTTRG